MVQHIRRWAAKNKRVLTRFSVKERIATSFVSEGGRVLLGGDAARVHSVNGGQGLNTGIADAFSVSWRLHMILNIEAGAKGTESLLQKATT